MSEFLRFLQEFKRDMKQMIGTLSLLHKDFETLKDLVPTLNKLHEDFKGLKESTKSIDKLQKTLAAGNLPELIKEMRKTNESMKTIMGSLIEGKD